MAILRLQHVGFSLHDLKAACARMEQLFGLTARDYRNDQGRGFQLDSRVLLGNDCWLHLVQNWNPESRVNQFLSSKGPGLEHISLQTDTIEEDVAHLRELCVPIYMDKIFNAPDGFEAFVYPDQTHSMTVELIQPHTTSWGYPTDGRAKVSSTLGITKLKHAGIIVKDLRTMTDRFEELFGLKATDVHDHQARITMGNECWLHITEADPSDAELYAFFQKQGAGLEHLAFETPTLDADIAKMQASGVEPPAVINRTGKQDASVERDAILGMRVEFHQA